jgi:hypothetical protein
MPIIQHDYSEGFYDVPEPPSEEKLQKIRENKKLVGKRLSEISDSSDGKNRCVLISPMETELVVSPSNRTSDYWSDEVVPLDIKVKSYEGRKLPENAPHHSQDIPIQNIDKLTRDELWYYLRKGKDLENYVKLIDSMHSKQR